MVPLNEHVLLRADATIRYWTAGSAEATAIVLLHGATLDHQAWAPQTDALSRRFHVVVPDLRGHGASSGPFEFHAAVEDILALLDELPSRQIVLVGLSLGGNIAQEVLRRSAGQCTGARRRRHHLQHRGSTSARRFPQRGRHPAPGGDGR